MGFLGGDKNLPFLLNSLNKCIDVINRDGRYTIKERADVFTQEFSNAIHHHFEVLAGSSTAPSAYYKSSSAEVLLAVDSLNYFVHDLESYTRNSAFRDNHQEGNVRSVVVVEVKERDRIEIPKSFDNYFTMKVEFGDLVAHYGQLGKTWPEAFYDRDQDIFPEAIRPLSVLSGEFDLFFGELNPDKNFLDQLHSFLRTHGQDPLNSSLRLGQLPLAKLDRLAGLSERDYKDRLAVFCDIKSIKAFEGDNCLIKKIF